MTLLDGRGGGANNHAAAVGELDCVIAEVDQHLTQPARVTQYKFRHGVIHMASQRKAFHLGACIE